LRGLINRTGSNVYLVIGVEERKPEGSNTLLSV
jgi:hypothetical protein